MKVQQTEQPELTEKFSKQNTIELTPIKTGALINLEMTAESILTIQQLISPGTMGVTLAILPPLTTNLGMMEAILAIPLPSTTSLEMMGVTLAIPLPVRQFGLIKIADLWLMGVVVFSKP